MRLKTQGRRMCTPLECTPSISQKIPARHLTRSIGCRTRWATQPSRSEIPLGSVLCRKEMKGTQLNRGSRLVDLLDALVPTPPPGSAFHPFPQPSSTECQRRWRCGWGLLATSNLRYCHASSGRRTARWKRRASMGHRFDSAPSSVCSRRHVQHRTTRGGACTRPFGNERHAIRERGPVAWTTKPARQRRGGRWGRSQLQGRRHDEEDGGISENVLTPCRAQVEFVMTRKNEVA